MKNISQSLWFEIYMDNICKNCEYWKDFNYRVHAKLSMNYKSGFAGNYLELRVCKYSVPPALAHEHRTIYTDENFTCSEFKKVNG